MLYRYRLPDGRVVAVADFNASWITYTLASGRVVDAIRVPDSEPAEPEPSPEERARRISPPSP